MAPADETPPRRDETPARGDASPPRADEERPRDDGSPSSRDGAPPPAKVRGRRASLLVAALVCLLLALVWSVGLDPRQSVGWDESMHSELPAARMLLSLRAGDVEGALAVLHGCAQYPFVWPLALAAVQAVTGLSEHACRVAGVLAWGALLLGLWGLGRELAEALERARPELARRDGPRPGALLPWLALALGLLSPLATAYAGTLFLEVPAAAVAAFALRAWLRARAAGGARAPLAAGAWLALAFFTKFNYGLLLAFGCGLDWLVDLALALRGGGAGRVLRRAAWVGLVPALALAWWFLAPLPFGAETAAGHREAFVAFLGGNRAMGRTPGALRLLHWCAGVAPSARALAVYLLAALASLSALRVPAVRTLWLVLLGGGLPVWTHPFHLDRFLIPGSVPLFALAALGLALVVGRARRWPVAAAALGGLALFGLVARDPGRVAAWTGQLSDEPARRAYQREVLAEWDDLGPGGRVPTGGLPRAEADALLGLVRAEVGPEERVGWFGLSSELSPAALHLALLADGGSPARFLRDAHRPMDVTFEGVDPGWSAARLADFAAGFDVVLATDPPDLRERATRAFARSYQERLITELGWDARRLGTISLSRPLRDDLAVDVYACRPK